VPEQPPAYPECLDTRKDGAKATNLFVKRTRKENDMGTVTYAILAMVITFASASAAAAAEKKLVSPALSINPNDGQPLCLVSNLSATATVAVTVEIVDGTGTVAVTTPMTLAPGTINGATDVLTNFYSYCRITPEESKHLQVIRGSHCIASGNTARVCVEATKK
jgi:hypothetical protein